MARLPFWTVVWHRLSRMWRTRFWRVMRACSRRPKSKNRYKPLGASKRYRVKSHSIKSSLGIKQKRRRYKRKGANHSIIELFVVTMLCALVFPFELLGRIAHIKPKKKSSHKHAKHHSSTTTASSAPRKQNTTKPQATPKPSQTTEKASDIGNATPSYVANHSEEPRHFEIPKEEPEEDELDETTPKSKPKSESDQYIRKRMLIAGSYYCEQITLDKLKIGTYFDIQQEPTNPYDKDAVVLLFEGEKIGYIAKENKVPFVTCLKLNRKIYGVITDIINEDGRTKYEYETWFSR